MFDPTLLFISLNKKFRSGTEKKVAVLTQLLENAPVYLELTVLARIFGIY